MALSSSKFISELIKEKPLALGEIYYKVGDGFKHLDAKETQELIDPTHKFKWMAQPSVAFDEETTKFVSSNHIEYWEKKKDFLTTRVGLFHQPETGFGTVAITFIPRGTPFGPYLGSILPVAPKDSTYCSTDFKGKYVIDAKYMGGIMRYAQHLPNKAELVGTEFHSSMDVIATQNVTFGEAVINNIPTPFLVALEDVSAHCPIGYSYSNWNTSFYLFSRTGDILAKVKYDVFSTSDRKVIRDISCFEAISSCLSCCSSSLFRSNEKEPLLTNKQKVTSQREESITITPP